LIGWKIFVKFIRLHLFIEEKAFVLAHLTKQNTFFCPLNNEAQDQRAQTHFSKVGQTSFI